MRNHVRDTRSAGEAIGRNMRLKQDVGLLHRDVDADLEHDRQMARMGLEVMGIPGFEERRARSLVDYRRGGRSGGQDGNYYLGVGKDRKLDGGLGRTVSMTDDVFSKDHGGSCRAGGPPRGGGTTASNGRWSSGPIEERETKRIRLRGDAVEKRTALEIEVAEKESEVAERQIVQAASVVGAAKAATAVRAVEKERILDEKTAVVKKHLRELAEVRYDLVHEGTFGGEGGPVGAANAAGHQQLSAEINGHYQRGPPHQYRGGELVEGFEFTKYTQTSGTDPPEWAEGGRSPLGSGSRSPGGNRSPASSRGVSKESFDIAREERGGTRLVQCSLNSIWRRGCNACVFSSHTHSYGIAMGVGGENA